MACDDPALLQRWIAQGSDPIEFEVLTLVEPRKTVEPLL
jgi:hypothetical protein